jgi:hypothetical protein
MEQKIDDGDKCNPLAVMRVDSTNVLDEGLRIEGRGRQMNSKVGFQKNKENIVY